MKHKLAHSLKKLPIGILRRRGVYLSLVALLIFSIAWTGTRQTPPSRAAVAAYPSAPTVICGDSSYLDGPSTAPAGAVVVPAGDNESLTPNWAGGFSENDKTFWFAPGVHTLGNGQFNQISPGNNTTFIGAPGAIIDGQGVNESAFSGYSTNVTIQNLTIRNFATPHDQGTVNHNGSASWTIKNNLLTLNAGAALFAARDNVVSYNCMKDNGQYGFQGASDHDTPTHILIDHNEITGNNAANTEASVGWVGCGCSGGAKFWAASDVTVSNNYVHDNLGIGLWADTLNVGFLFEGNWFENNDGPGLMYEVSYNFVIRNNVFKHNATVDGPGNPGFPTGAIYISESGSDSRVTSTGNNFSNASEIYGNLIVDNWSGVVLWENSDRFCSNGLPTTECTLVDPPNITVDSCQAAMADPVKSQPGYTTPNYFNDCRWLTKNVKVHDNIFRLNTANVAQCNVNKACGLNALFSNYGVTYPYDNSLVDTNITFNQGNSFYNNTYEGPWYFMGWAQSNQEYPLSFADWQAPVTDKCTTDAETSSGTCNTGFGQDAGSTYNAVVSSQPPTVNVTAPANGATVSGTISVTATASDDVSVSGVQFRVDGSNLGVEDTASPYSVSLNTASLSNGAHTISAIARDNDGLTTNASVTVTVSNSGGGTSTKIGDLNNDNAVNVLDLSILLSNWNKYSTSWTNAKSDLNLDGNVTVLDLSVLLSKWGT